MALMNAAEDGLPIAAGAEKDIPDLATKGVGIARVGCKCDAGSIDMEFAAIAFDKDGNFLDRASYRNRKSKDGSIEHQGDSTGDDPEFIDVSLGNISDNVQAIIFCEYCYSASNSMNDVKELKMVFKAKCQDTVVPVCCLIPTGDILKGDHSGVTTLAIYRSAPGKWKVKSVQSKGSGPDKNDMIPGCQAVFDKVGIKKV